MMPSLPFVSGVEGTGTVEDANEIHFKKGSRVAFLDVIGSAIYAEYVVLDAQKLTVLDNREDLLQAANALEIYPLDVIAFEGAFF